PLSGADGLRPQLADESDPRQQPCDAGHIVGARLQPIRQEVRHLLLDRDAAGAALQQCADGDVLPAQQHAGPLGAVQALVARHGDEGRPQGRHVQGQHPGGLGRVDDEGYLPLPADSGDSLHRLDETEYVGHVVADHRVRAGHDQAVKGRRHRCRLKQGRRRHGHLGSQGRQGPGDSVVLISGDHGFPAGRHQALDGNVQAVGGVHGEGHLLRVLQMVQLRQLCPAVEGSLRRTHGGGVSAAAGRAHGGHGVPHGVRHSPGLLEGGGR
ncbi:Enoyl-CoA hydratase/isomerase family protein, partial [Dysosmobacter welbionis]